MKLNATKFLDIITFGAAIALVSGALGCGGAEVVDASSGDGADQAGKADSGWLGSDSFEVNALVTGQVSFPATGDWEELATDPTLQNRLVDLQLKFIKTTAEGHGWRFNQLADTVEVTHTEEIDGHVTLHYEAVVDMLGRLRGALPTLDELDPREFPAIVPVIPDDFSFSDMKACSKTDDSHSVADYNFHYYFAPEQEGCAITLNEASVEITEVFERPITYPEYDQLLQEIDEETTGFYAALVPNRGDSDPLSRFNAHAEMLEQDLGLEGTDAEDGSYRRYIWNKDGVAIIIDLYDPTDIPWSSSFAASFREKLATYTFVHYNGHSSYGSKHLLDDPDSYSDAYQILSIHSCQSYAYYTRQVFRGKATEADPSGFALADVIATGKSSYPSGSPPTLRVLFTSLMDGMVAIRAGNPESAPDWLTITERISSATWGDILYGVAGVRTNAWQPE